MVEIKASGPRRHVADASAVQRAVKASLNGEEGAQHKYVQSSAISRKFVHAASCFSDSTQSASAGRLTRSVAVMAQ